MPRLLIKLLLKFCGFNFVNIHDGAVFLARDERALNCAVRDYVDALDKGREEIEEFKLPFEA